MSRCMCGDPCCPWCGPAQGNSRCDVCGRWASDGGCVNPEECRRKSEEMTERFAREMEEGERLAREFWESQ